MLTTKFLWSSIYLKFGVPEFFFNQIYEVLISMFTTSATANCFTSTHRWSGFAMRAEKVGNFAMGVNANTINIENNIEVRAEDTSALLGVYLMS